MKGKKSEIAKIKKSLEVDHDNKITKSVKNNSKNKIKSDSYQKSNKSSKKDTLFNSNFDNFINQQKEYDSDEILADDNLESK